MSSGSGSKNRGGTRNFPLARPTGRGLRAAWGIARSSATGTLWLQITTVSPPAAAAIYADSLALACATLTFKMTTIVTINVLVCKQPASARFCHRKGQQGEFLRRKIYDLIAYLAWARPAVALRCSMAPHLTVSCGRLALL